MTPAARSESPLRRGWTFVRTVAERFYADGCLVHASALAYTTLLSLVPVLALMFAVLKGLGTRENLERWLLTQLGLSAEVTDRIVGFVSETNAGTLTSLGVVALLFTAISVLGNVESTLNRIWRVRADRLWWRKITDYLSVVLVTPFLLLAGFGATSFLAEQQTLRGLLDNEIIGEAWAHVLRLVPYGFNVVALGVVYTVMPNRRPHFRAILIAAIVAGISWQIVQIGYVQLQIGVARANLLYGALAQLPVTLVWLYVSWTIVLAGAEIAAVTEFGVDGDVRGDVPVPLWAVAVQVLMRAGRRFAGPGGPIDSHALAREMQVEAARIETAALRLEADGWLVAVAGPESGWVLARDPRTVDLDEVAAAFEPPSPATWDAALRELLGRADRKSREVLVGVSLADLLEPDAPARERHAATGRTRSR